VPSTQLTRVPLSANVHDEPWVVGPSDKSRGPVRAPRFPWQALRAVSQETSLPLPGHDDTTRPAKATSQHIHVAVPPPPCR
jgi:hypothetical protein